MARASIARMRGEPELAEELLERAEQHASDAGDEHLVAQVLVHRAQVWIRIGDSERAKGALEIARRQFAAFGDDIHGAHCLLGLAGVAYAKKDFEAQIRHGQEALAVANSLGSAMLAVYADNLIGIARQLSGDLDGAADAYRASLQSVRRGGAFDGSVQLINLAIIDVDQGNYAAGRSAIEAVLTNPGVAGTARAAGQAALMLCLAHHRDWIRWDETLGALQAWFEESSYAEVGGARLLAEAADEAARAGERERSNLALAHAAQLWETLGHPQQAAAVRERIERSG